METDSVFLKKDMEQFHNLCTVARINGITFTKAQAAEWVGGRYQLERLVREHKIRMVKTSARQNAPWQCHAEDVIRHAARYD
jgi:hypothetical protein